MLGPILPFLEMSHKTHSQPGILEPLRLPELSRSAQGSNDQDPAGKSVRCLLCELEFAHPNQKDDCLKHLLEEHRFVIADVNMVADFPAYVRYWKNKFEREPVVSFCTTMKAEVSRAPPGNGQASSRSSHPAKQEYFYLLSDIIQEDKELRKKLQMDRLEQVLAVQEAERNDTEFSRSCLFCRQHFTRPADLFDHMAFDHNFSVGQPDNLVFVSRLLDKLQHKLDNLVCLYCEKIFKNREVLKEHMRKKGHRKIDSHNAEYDEFYLVNYLEFGKNWEDISKEKGDEDLPTGFDSDREEDGDWSDWRGDVGGAVCLFCPVLYVDKENLLNHMLEVHGFDFQKFKTEQNLNFYQQIKLINYIRRCVHLKTCIGCGEVFPTHDEMMKHLSWSGHYHPAPDDWNQPQFYFPTYENDNLLHVLEDDDEPEDQPQPPKARPSASGVRESGRTCDTSVPIVPEEVIMPEDSILYEEGVRKSLGTHRVTPQTHYSNKLKGAPRGRHQK